MIGSNRNDGVMNPTRKTQDVLRRVAQRLRLRPNPVAQQKGCTLPQRVVVSTHHKTGTTWLRSVFSAVASYHNLALVIGTDAPPSGDADIVFDQHAAFDATKVSWPFRGVHVIRDPRDVIVSGCHYHQKAHEAWLHKPNPRFGGMTYQQKINSLATFDEQLLFEMRALGRHTINAMLAWDYTQPSFLEVTYEALMQDVDLRLFHEIFAFVGFPGAAIPSALAIAYNNSLFSGKPVANAHHVRSGAARQWRQHFKRQHGERFVELFGDALIRLGYETDDGWLANLPA
jgi:hypothetical protein